MLSSLQCRKSGLELYGFPSPTVTLQIPPAMMSPKCLVDTELRNLWMKLRSNRLVLAKATEPGVWIDRRGLDWDAPPGNVGFRRGIVGRRRSLLGRSSVAWDRGRGENGRRKSETHSAVYASGWELTTRRRKPPWFMTTQPFNFGDPMHSPISQLNNPNRSPENALAITLARNRTTTFALRPPSSDVLLHPSKKPNRKSPASRTTHACRKISRRSSPTSRAALIPLFPTTFSPSKLRFQPYSTRWASKIKPTSSATTVFSTACSTVRSKKSDSGSNTLHLPMISFMTSAMCSGRILSSHSEAFPLPSMPFHGKVLLRPVFCFIIVFNLIVRVFFNIIKYQWEKVSVTLTAMDEFIYVFNSIFPFRFCTVSIFGRATCYLLTWPARLEKDKP